MVAKYKKISLYVNRTLNPGNESRWDAAPTAVQRAILLENAA